jgi:hypothetical protein
MLLVGGIVGFAMARHDVANERASRRAALQRVEPERQAVADLNGLRQQLRELKSKVEAQNVAEEVVENPWFEWMGIIGTGVIASSFYVEAIVRRSRGT